MSHLWEAYDVLRKDGMCKFARKKGNGQHCAIGLLDEVHNHEVSVEMRAGADGKMVSLRVVGGCEYCDECREDLKTLEAVIEEQFPDRLEDAGLSAVSRVVTFNNHVQTTQEDLELVFNKGAVNADALLSS